VRLCRHPMRPDSLVSCNGIWDGNRDGTRDVHRGAGRELCRVADRT
jgi:hypothetical protein